MGRFTTVFVIGGVLLGAPLFLKSTISPPLLAAGGGTVSGRVVLVGDAPQAKKIEITKDREKCGSEKISEELVVSPDRGIKNAVVSLNGVKGSAAGAATPVLDQKGCVFSPRVVIATPGKPVDILNNDGILHNVHTYSSKNPPINKAQPAFKKKMTESFSQAEIIKVTCDAHPWMTGWIVVTDQPAAATDGAGAFKLTDVPAGNHTLEIWHETLGKVSKQISVKAGEETKVTIELSKK
jgi:plastocyanin